MLFPLRHKSCLPALLLLLLPFQLWAFDYLQPLPETPLIPDENPLTPAKVSLGKKLFYDTRLLGAESRLSCNSCHNLAKGGDDGKALSVGHAGKLTRRSSPSLWNIGIQTVYFWDGRATSLETQTLDHLRDPVISAWPDMGSLVQAISASREYQQAFASAFPDEEISASTLSRAIASFERALLAKNSRFDRYIKGDESALSRREKRGMQAFNDAGCLACHFGANFAGPAPGPALQLGDGFYELFPNNLGTEYEARYRLADDLGRFAFTGDPTEIYMWRVPPLRNIELTAPYFHNGSVKTLHEAVRVMGKAQFNKDLPDSTVKDIVAFLKSLSGETPELVRTR